MPDLDPHDLADLDRRLQALTATYVPGGRPALDVLLGRARRRRRTRLAGALVALAAVAGVPALVLPALRDHDQTLAGAASDGTGLCPDATARYEAWRKTAASGGLDLRRLERYDVAGSYAPPLGTLQAAREDAERIVAGTVTDVRFDDQGSLLTVRVDRTVKGPPSRELVLRTGNGLSPAHEGLEYAKDPAVRRTATPRVVQVPASLSLDAGAPLLLPGQRAVWLLQTGQRGLAVQFFTGQYASCRGRVTATEGNPFAAQVDGLTEQDLLGRLRD